MDRISGKTLIIYYDNFNTVMINTDGKMIINGNFIRSILNKSCIFYGSSLNGRLKGSKDLLKCRYKLPIIISESNRLIFFPVKTITSTINKLIISNILFLLLFLFFPIF